MRGTMTAFRGAVLGLMICGVTVVARGPGSPVPPPTTPNTRTAPVSPTTVAVTVNGEHIYEVAIQRALERVPAAHRAEMRVSLVSYLVDNLIIDQALRNAGYKAEPADVDKRVNDMKTELKKVGKDFDKMLGELKVSENELRTHIAADLRWFKYASAQATDQALEALFKKEIDLFDGTTVRASHILVTCKTKDDRTKAAAIATLRSIRAEVEKETQAGLTKLPATADKLAVAKARGELMSTAFGKYAKAKSECTATKDRGGDVNWFRKAGFMVQPFSEAAFALQVNQMSDAVETPFGYHLILVTDRKPGREAKFADMKEIVKEVYFDRLHDSLASQLRGKAKVTYAGQAAAAPATGR